jgi:hypothetical protein
MPQPHASSREARQYQASIWVPVQHLLRKWLMGAMCFDSLAGGRQTLWWLTQVSQTHPSHAHHTYLTWKRLLHIHASNGSRYAQKCVSLASDFTHCAEPSAPLRHWNYTLWLCPHGSSFPSKSSVAAIWLKLSKLNRGFPWFVSIFFAHTTSTCCSLSSGLFLMSCTYLGQKCINTRPGFLQFLHGSETPQSVPNQRVFLRTTPWLIPLTVGVG